MQTDHDRLNELVGWLADTAKSTEAFVVEQAPDVARQVIAWGFWSHAIQMAICLVIGAVGLVLLRVLWNKSRVALRENGGKWDILENDQLPYAIPGVLIAIGTAAVFIAGVSINLPTMIQCKVAPKVYLLQEASRLLK